MCPSLFGDYLGHHTLDPDNKNSHGTTDTLSSPKQHFIEIVMIN